jgi:hypothetical protein
MPNYLFAYRRGAEGPGAGDGPEAMARWQAWIGRHSGSMVDPGTPLGPSRMVRPDGVAAESELDCLTGFSIVRADDLDSALAMAGSCPFLEMGTIEVAEIKQMQRASGA